MRLSPHFTLAEMTFSQTAARKVIDNTPSDEVIEHLRFTCQGMEGVRRILDERPIIVSSGYRSEELNLAIGGSPTSGHPSGWCVDFTCPSFGTPRDVWHRLSVANFEFDQLILEFGRWVHLSFDPRARRQVFTIG